MCITIEFFSMWIIQSLNSWGFDRVDIQISVVYIYFSVAHLPKNDYFLHNRANWRCVSVGDLFSRLIPGFSAPTGVITGQGTWTAGRCPRWRNLEVFPRLFIELSYFFTFR
jgi:hypothetical protein